jgi:6,7-dimethyl-8-ribityllumazine synthase
MLKPIKATKMASAGGSMAIIASQYNARYVDSMLSAARAELKRAGVRKIQVIRVPGAFEIPVVVARLARLSSPHATRNAQSVHLSAIVCLGVVLRGETTHAAHIAENVSRALMQIQLQHEIPVIHEVLLLENEEQARVRCLGARHNRGAEAAQTALAMAKVMRELGRATG